MDIKLYSRSCETPIKICGEFLKYANYKKIYKINHYIPKIYTYHME